MSQKDVRLMVGECWGLAAFKVGEMAVCPRWGLNGPVTAIGNKEIKIGDQWVKVALAGYPDGELTENQEKWLDALLYRLYPVIDIE